MTTKAYHLPMLPQAAPSTYQQHNSAHWPYDKNKLRNKWLNK